jgi:hypothetical protein
MVFQAIFAGAASYLLGWLGYVSGIVAYVEVPERMIFTLFIVACFLVLTTTVRLHKIRVFHKQISSTITEAKRQASA